MKITINIDERTGVAIREFCKVNNLKQNQYLVDIIEKQFNIDRFGDMNEMLGKKEKPKQVKMELVKEKTHETSQQEATVELQETPQLIPQTHSKRILKVK